MTESGSSVSRPPTPQLVVRFLLELVLLASLAIWGWQLGEGGIRGTLIGTILLLTAATIWGVFGAENDGSRGRPVVVVPGWVRLLLEVALILLGAIGIWTSWSRAAAEMLLTAFALHYALIWERNWRLLRPNVRR
jgi:hypothetical protein